MAEERRPRERIRALFGLDSPRTPAPEPTPAPRRGGLRSPAANAARAAEADRAMANEDTGVNPMGNSWTGGGRARRGREAELARMPPVDQDFASSSSIPTLPMAAAAADGPAVGNRRAAPAARPQGRRRTAPRAESMTADDLNEISLRLARGATPTTDTEKRLARAMGLNFKKGGLVPPMRGANGKAPPPTQKGPPNMFKKKR